MASVAVALSPPSIIVQPPANATLTPGSSFLLTATAAGALPLSYQWQEAINGVYVNYTNSGDISGSTSDALDFSAIAGSDAANYQLIVTNAYGAITSQVATVTVFIPSTNNSVRMGISDEYVTNYSDWVDAFLARQWKNGNHGFWQSIE